MNPNRQWFETWFDSPYYPMLYQNRGEEEASKFIDQIIQLTGISTGKRVLDLACGSGRHSRTLHSHGLETIGYDISSNRISEAQANSEAGILYKKHDMRRPFPDGRFDMVVNLFTSFGYFETEAENHFILGNIQSSLKIGGYFVLDYLNVPYILKNLKKTDSFVIDNIDFQIKRYSDNHKIFKEIKIIDGEKRYAFIEKIRAFEQKELEILLQKSGFEIVQLWGDYRGTPFCLQHSPRLIFVAKKLRTVRNPLLHRKHFPDM